MGEVIVPLLLRELEKKSGRWFWALKCITREDPVPPESRGKTQEMIKAWLEWGTQKGYNAFYPSTRDIMKLTELGGALEFLNNEPELYTLEDGEPI
jgi:hypothetical protein